MKKQPVFAPATKSYTGKPEIVTVSGTIKGKPVQTRLEIRRRVVIEARQVDGYSYSTSNSTLDYNILDGLMSDYFDMLEYPDVNALESEFDAWQDADDDAGKAMVALAMKLFGWTKDKAESDVSNDEFFDWAADELNIKHIDEELKLVVDNLK